jgi:hypothetical protein
MNTMDEKTKELIAAQGGGRGAVQPGPTAPGVCGKGMDADMMRVMMKAMPE